MITDSIHHKRHIEKNERGQTLIEILVAMAILSILAQSIFTVVSTSLNYVSFNRARITARHLAQEKIELIRNLPYDNIGTTGGIPNGPIPQEETISRNGLTFRVKTTIIYIDDPYDQTSPNDLLATDYKRVRVEVSWNSLSKSRKNPVVLLTDISPKGVESVAGGGTLSIVVFDANGKPVPGANVSIVNSTTQPNINLTIQTPDNGRITLPGAPACTSCYQISVTKNGYSSERTYSTSEVANPNKPHQTVLEGQLTEITFAIDRTSSLDIYIKKDRQNNFEPFPNITFRLRGEKTIGVDAFGQPVYKYDKIHSADSSGYLSLANLEWDNYQFIQPSDYDVSGSNPNIPISILPQTSNTLNIALSSPASQHNLLITFVDSANNRISSVSATLSNNSGFSQSQTSGTASNPDFGQVFFPNLFEVTYSLTATASGFLDYQAEIGVTGQTRETVLLISQ